MLQFNKSETTNKNAVWIDTVNTDSGYYDNLVVVYSQSYDNSNGQFSTVATSTPNAYRNWLVIENAGTVVPTPSGQYDVEIWKVDLIPAVWQQVAKTWDSYNEIWDSAGDEGLLTRLYSDRAYISGSNETSITQYLSPNENGTYTTYNG